MGKSRQTGKLSSDGMLFPSVTDGKVGIGTNVPSETLHIQGSARLTGELKDYYNVSGTAGQILVSTGSGVSWTSDGSTITGVGAPGYWESNTVGLSTSSHVSIGAGLSITGISTFGDTLKVYNSGNDSYIDNIGSGALYIRDTNGTGTNQIIIQARGGENSIVAVDDGTVELYYDAVKKFETANTGVKITGGLLDKDGDIGSSGQVLSSTGSELNWVDAAVASQGAQGVQGVKGRGAGVVYRFSTTSTKADPGAGYFRFDDTIINQVTEIYIDHNDFQNVSQTSWIGNWSSIAGTNPIGYLHIQLFNYTWTFEVTDIVDESVNQGTQTYYTLTVSLSAGSNTTIPNNNHCSIFFVPTGLQGVQGGLSAQGAQGLQGIKGDTGNFGGASFEYNFDSTVTDSDPGSGNLRLIGSAQSDQNARTQINIDDNSTNATDISSYLATIDASTSTIKGHVKITKFGDASAFILATISSETDQTGYHTITISPVDSSASNPFSNGDQLLVTFARTGDKGETGLQGNQGTQGVQGFQGTQGVGSQGTQGVKGADSHIPGPQGAQGIQATQGLQGLQGVGFQGLQGAAGSGSAITVQDDGTPLTTAASVLNFVGSGVVASGTGSTKTITISGGGGGSSTTRTVTTQTVSSATDTYSVTYDVGYLDVYLNGVRLETGEFTATNGTSVVLDNDTHVGDVIEFVAYSSVSLTSVEVSDDTTPELGGHLDLNGYNITGIGSISITGDISANNVQMATQNDAIAFAIALG